MTVWQALIIGLLQGLTEFLPISSSGHMLLAGKIMDIEITLGFELAMHLATLLAVIMVLHKDVWSVLRHPIKNKNFRLLLIATVPGAVIVFALKGVFETTLDGSLLPYCFLLTAILLLTAGFVKHRQKKEMSYLDAAIIGTAQGFAVFPGISRSGTTISTAVMLGNDTDTSAKFSFLLSIPIILGSGLVEIIGGGLDGVKPVPLAVGFISAFVSGYLAVRFMLKKLGKSFDFFALYLLALSIFLFLNNLFLHWF